jgi:hypothetical protein
MTSFLLTAPTHGETRYWFKESRDSWSGPELLFSFEPVLFLRDITCWRMA